MEIKHFKKLVRLLRTKKKYERLLLIRDLNLFGEREPGETGSVSPRPDRNSRKKRHR